MRLVAASAGTGTAPTAAGALRAITIVRALFVWPFAPAAVAPGAIGAVPVIAAVRADRAHVTPFIAADEAIAAVVLRAAIRSGDGEEAAELANLLAGAFLLRHARMAVAAGFALEARNLEAGVLETALAVGAVGIDVALAEVAVAFVAVAKVAFALIVLAAELAMRAGRFTAATEVVDRAFEVAAAFGTGAEVTVCAARQVLAARELGGIALVARVETAGIAVVADVVAADRARIGAGRNADIV